MEEIPYNKYIELKTKVEKMLRKVMAYDSLNYYQQINLCRKTIFAMKDVEII
jgi:hypothetical protein